MSVVRRGRWGASLFAIAVVACGRETNDVKEQSPAANVSTPRSDESTSGNESVPRVDNTVSDESGDGLVVDVPTDGFIENPDGATCTPDLRAVVNGAGQLIRECPSDQGCANGECIAACDAAAQSNGSIGCEFWAPTPPFEDQRPLCHALFLANTWTRPAKLRLTYGGEEFEVALFARIPRGKGANVAYEPLPDGLLPPNEVAVIFLSDGGANNPSLNCPAPVAVVGSTFIRDAARGAAFHVYSDTPVSAHHILPYGAGHFPANYTSASLLLPTTSWSTNYIITAPRMFGAEWRTSYFDLEQLWASIVAQEDDTTVKVLPPTSLLGGDRLEEAPAGEVTEYTLAAGEVIQWLDRVVLSGFDPTGTVIESDKPIGLWTGNTILSVATATSVELAQNEASHQQLPPIQSIGNEYVGSGIRTRRPNQEPESVGYRLIGLVDGTTLTYDPRPEAAPVRLDAGQTADFETSELFSVRSQDADHPFLFTLLMPAIPETIESCAYEQPGCTMGNVDWVIPISTQQYLRRYAFFTDPTYSETNVTAIRKKHALRFHDVSLECIGKINGWEPVGSEGAFEVAHVDLVKDGVSVNECETIVHVATSDGPFGLLVWGSDWQTSYGYPAGGNFGVNNKVRVPARVR
jgi:hypothetical protein